MKLNKPEAASAADEMTPVTGGATIAARFQLDAEPLPLKKPSAAVGKTSTLVALVVGYLAAYWYLLARCPLPVKEFKQDGGDSAIKIGRSIAPVFGCVLVAIVVLASMVNRTAFSLVGPSAGW